MPPALVLLAYDDVGADGVEHDEDEASEMRSLHRLRTCGTRCSLGNAYCGAVRVLVARRPGADEVGVCDGK